MNRTSVLACGVACLLFLVGGSAYAGPTIDFSTLGTGLQGNTLGPNATSGQITIKGFQTNFTTTADLWLRNSAPDDVGVGVCSSGETDCGGTGDQNELSNETNLEWIVLALPANEEWSGLWLSSLDSGGTGGKEQGTIYWANTLGDLTTGTGKGSFTFGWPEFGGSAVDGNLFSVTAFTLAFNPFAKYVMFRAGTVVQGTTGFNNDYLIWGADLTTCQSCGVNNIPTPEPLTLSLFGAGLVGVVALRSRRRKHA